VRAVGPRKVALKPLPKYLYGPIPTTAATTVANRPTPDNTTTSSLLPEPVRKRKLGNRPRTAHEHFEVRVQWSTPAGQSSDTDGSADNDKVASRCCGDVFVASCASVSVALVRNGFLTVTLLSPA
jgi:hypothetical protein